MVDQCVNCGEWYNYGDGDTLFCPKCIATITPRYVAHVRKDYRGRVRIHFKGQNESAEKLIVHKLLPGHGPTVDEALASFGEFHEGEIIDTVWYFVEQDRPGDPGQLDTAHPID